MHFAYFHNAATANTHHSLAMGISISPSANPVLCNTLCLNSSSEASLN